MADSLAELALDLSRASLARQEAQLSDLRSRAGTLLAAASIAGSLLASRRGEIDLDAAHRAVTEWFDDMERDNEAKLGVLGRWYTASCLGVAAEVLFWTVNLTGIV